MDFADANLNLESNKYVHNVEETILDELINFLTLEESTPKSFPIVSIICSCLPLFFSREFITYSCVIVKERAHPSP